MPNPSLHDATGKFRKGNPGGPGNPEFKRNQQYRDALRQAVTKQDFKDVILKLVFLAKQGDVQAIKILLDRCLGKAPQNINVNNLNGQFQPITIEFREAPSANDNTQ